MKGAAYTNIIFADASKFWRTNNMCQSDPKIDFGPNSCLLVHWGIILKDGCI